MVWVTPGETMVFGVLVEPVGIEGDTTMVGVVERALYGLRMLRFRTRVVVDPEMWKRLRINDRLPDSIGVPERIQRPDSFCKRRPLCRTPFCMVISRIGPQEAGSAAVRS